MTEFRCKPSNLSRSRSLRAFCAASITLRFSSTLIESPPPSAKALGTLNAPLLGSHPDSASMFLRITVASGFYRGWIQLDSRTKGPAPSIIPGMVDAHSHLTLPGGSHWIDRGADPPEELLEVAEHNGDLLGRAGVRWARDVGSPLAVDPRDGRRRALALRVRERWRSDLARPKVRVAGTWISHSGVLTGGLLIEADDGPSLLRAASTQLEDGADFLKLYLDGPEQDG